MRALLVTLTALAVLLMGSGSALADPPLSVDHQLTDTAGALGADAPAVRSALDRLEKAEGTRVVVVLVSGFDVPEGSDWAAETASESELADSDMLVAIDVSTGAYEWWTGDSFPLPPSDIDGIMTTDVEPQLATGAWARALFSLADGLTPATSTFLGGPAEPRPWSGTTTALVCGIVVVTLVGGHLLSRRRTTTAATTQ